MSTQTPCPSCGTQVSPGTPFCPRCGSDLRGGQPSRAPTPAGGLPVGQVQTGAASKPWPFSPEVLAQQLVAGGLLAKPVLDALYSEAAASGKSLPDLIVERRQMSAEGLRDAMSKIFGLPVADLRSLAVDPVLIARFPSEPARRHLFLPLHQEGTRLLMVVADPTQAEAVRSVRRALGLTIDLRLATAAELAPQVHRYFSPKLVVLLPSGETFEVPVGVGEVKIGKAEHNELVLNDPAVSGTHAILRAAGEEFHIVDFGSRNGVFVGGNRVSGSQALKNGDVITIGQCLLTFKLPAPEARQAPAGGTLILAPGQIPTPMKGVPLVAPAPAQAKAAAAAAEAVAAEEKGEKKKKKKEKEKEKEKGKGDEKIKSAWIGFVGRIIAQIVGAAATILLGLLVAGKLSCGTAGTTTPDRKPSPQHGTPARSTVNEVAPRK